MKYVITDKDQVAIGVGYHSELARELEGKVIRAGHCLINPDGTFKVWGGSYGYDIDAKLEDADILARLTKEKSPRAKYMKYLSLFSGIGGLEKGIQQAYEKKNSRVVNSRGQVDTVPRGQETKYGTGVGNTSSEFSSDVSDESAPTCIGYSEIDKYAIQVYQKHFPNHKNYGDITKIEADNLPDFDFLCGGFPCQSFSIAGKRKGFEDTRGTLFFDIARILKAKRPRLLLLENVKGLLSHDNGDTFKTIISTLDELGYDLQWQVLNSKNFGVPQNRERVFIVGHLRGTSRPQVFPFGGDGTEDNRTRKPVFSTIRATYPGNWNGDYIATDTEYRQTQVSSTINSGGGGQGAKTGLYKIEGKIRRLTPTECMRLQGFPDTWCDGISDTQKYKCAGNAVTVNVIEAIVDNLLVQNRSEHGRI
jgi:DNA (cytosine-5)-methyltransferase 1